MKQNDVGELSMKPRRHVGGIPNANRQWVQLRKHEKSDARFAHGGPIFRLVYNSNTSVCKQRKFTTRSALLQHCVPSTWRSPRVVYIGTM